MGKNDIIFEGPRKNFKKKSGGTITSYSRGTGAGKMPRTLDKKIRKVMKDQKKG
jgi:hypothetical protein